LGWITGERRRGSEGTVFPAVAFQFKQVQQGPAVQAGRERPQRIQGQPAEHAEGAVGVFLADGTLFGEPENQFAQFLVGFFPRNGRQQSSVRPLGQKPCRNGIPVNWHVKTISHNLSLVN